MSLIKSISGIRGTIGGATGDTLKPLDIVKFTTAYATFIRKSTPNGSNKIVVGRDARISGEMVKNVVCGTLLGMGYDVVNIGLASTPTTELAVTMAGADGGIIITASHNPRHWNALKLLNNKGEFLTAADGNEVLAIAEAEAFEYADVDFLITRGVIITCICPVALYCSCRKINIISVFYKLSIDCHISTAISCTYCFNIRQR